MPEGLTLITGVGRAGQVGEVVARTGLDWVLVDLEHGTSDEAGLVSLTTAIASAGPTSLVRIESGSRVRVGRALDLGARGVMVPQVHSADMARDLVTVIPGAITFVPVADVSSGTKVVRINGLLPSDPGYALR